MRKPERLVCFAAAIVIGIAGLYPNARAYTPSADTIFRLTAEAMGARERLFVSQKTSYFYESRPDPVIVNETLMYQFPDRFRSEMITGSGQRIHIFSAGETLTVVNDKQTSDSGSVFERFKDALLYRTPDAMRRFAKSSGIDDSVVSLGRFEGKSAFVIGAAFPDLSRPQLWIEKNDFLPYRLILTGDVTGVNRNSPVEFRYLDWKAKKGVQYPFQLEIYENEILVISSIVQQIAVNPSFPEAVFNIRSIKDKIAPFQESAEDSIPESLDEVRKTIEEFRKRYEFDNSGSDAGDSEASAD